jgi:hypothetical protein
MLVALRLLMLLLGCVFVETPLRWLKVVVVVVVLLNLMTRGRLLELPEKELIDGEPFLLCSFV